MARDYITEFDRIERAYNQWRNPNGSVARRISKTTGKLAAGGAISGAMALQGVHPAAAAEVEVQPGDSLYELVAEQNPGLSDAELLEATFDVAEAQGIQLLEREDGSKIALIYPGDVIDVPSFQTQRTVQSGETLFSIAREIDPTHVDETIVEIADLNGVQLEESDGGTFAHIQPGQTLQIPTPRAQLYTVQAGDTLSEIAENTGVESGVISDLNRISNPDHIVAGEEIVIPSPQADEIPEVVEINLQESAQDVADSLGVEVPEQPESEPHPAEPVQPPAIEVTRPEETGSGPEAAPTEVEAEPASEPASVTVEEGMTASGIASVMSVVTPENDTPKEVLEEIADANNTTVEELSMIHPGQELSMPPSIDEHETDSFEAATDFLEEQQAPAPAPIMPEVAPSPATNAVQVLAENPELFQFVRQAIDGQHRGDPANQNEAYYFEHPITHEGIQLNAFMGVSCDERMIPYVAMIYEEFKDEGLYFTTCYRSPEHNARLMEEGYDVDTQSRHMQAAKIDVNSDLHQRVGIEAENEVLLRLNDYIANTLGIQYTSLIHGGPNANHNDLDLHPELLPSPHDLIAAVELMKVAEYVEAAGIEVEQVVHTERIQMYADARNENVRHAMDTLINDGFTPRGAAYIVGSMMTESSMNPEALNPAEDARGILQWRFERLEGMPGDFDGQVRFAIDEMQRDSIARNHGVYEILRDPNASDEQLEFAMYRWIRWGHEGARHENAQTIIQQMGA